MPESIVYFVIGRDGHQYGPASETEVRGWLASRRITIDTLSWRSGEATWQPLRARPELMAGSVPIHHQPTTLSTGSEMTCAAKAKQYVHRAAAGGAAIAPIPIPGIGTAGLVTIEGSLVYWIGRVYGERLTTPDIAAITGTLGVGSMVVKVGVMEALNFVPILGWTLKSGIAAGIIETIGNLAIKHFEARHPGKIYVVDVEIEGRIAGASPPVGADTDSPSSM